MQYSNHEPRYVMEGPSEGARLETKTSPIETEKQLRLVGLQSGMAVLDAGCGTGAVARVMSRLVGPEGSVTAADMSSARLDFGLQVAKEELGNNLKFVKADLTQAPIGTGSFDLVWCRFVFEYLEQPEAMLENLVRSVRIGGKVVVGDLDGNGQFHFPMSEKLERGMELILTALGRSFDPYVGRKLFGLFRKQKLDNVQVHVLPYHLYAGSAAPQELENWKAKFETLRTIGAKALGNADEYDGWVSEFLRHLSDPDGFTYSVLMLAEGVRIE